MKGVAENSASSKEARSLPAITVYPVQRITSAGYEVSASKASIAAASPSITAPDSAFTGALSITRTAMSTWRLQAHGAVHAAAALARSFISRCGRYTSTVSPLALLTVFWVRTTPRSPLEVRRDSTTSQCT